ncbi:MAG TPA: cytochrome c biogenesis protein ResB [Pyrinomonadaceae bacterium]|nr:cytochrome c biogenesis protein ResB [Pyrinomonadaceae bacterium]
MAARKTASETTLLERIVTFAVGLALVGALKFFVRNAMSGYDMAGLLLVAATVAAVGIQRVLDFLSSVRVGVSLLVLLVLASMVGMLVMQVNVEGFEDYYAGLTPSQKLLGSYLNFFDIYHSRYFNFLLLVLSLNIVLTSIDHFPKAWTYIARKKLDASPHWLRGQEQHAVVTVAGVERGAAVERIAAAFRAAGLKPTVTEKKGKTFVFGESGAWNRLGAYAVHVALLTIFTGGFLTAQLGRTGQMPLKPGATANEMSEIVFRIDDATQEFTPARDSFPLPFQVTCTDIQQKLIKTDGPITADNTLDWSTQVRIKDETGERDALIHLNHPYDYGGYRFFQQSFQARGNARSIKLRLTPERGGEPLEVSIRRDGEATLADGTRIAYTNFFPEFVMAGGQPDTASGDYNRPAAMLTVYPATGGTPERAFAFSTELPEGIPVGAAKGGYKFKLLEFEKVPDVHILSIQRDPGANIVYLGFALLALTLCAVFFFSHRRVWAHVEERDAHNFEVTLGGNTNRNRLAFGDRFKRLAEAIGGPSATAENANEVS